MKLQKYGNTAALQVEIINSGLKADKQKELTVEEAGKYLK